MSAPSAALDFATIARRSGCDQTKTTNRTERGQRAGEDFADQLLAS